MGLTLPVVGVTAGSTAAGLVGAALSAIISRLETKVTPSSIDVNSDLSFKSGVTNYGAKDLQRAAFASLSAVLAAASYPTTLYVVSGNLHYNDGAGNAIQMTSGGTLNIASSGGITGAGYGAGGSGVEVNWDSVNTKYRFRSGNGTDSFAAVECDDVLLRDGSGNAIRLAAPALGTDYTLTLPNAVPAASGSLLLMDTAGAITTSRAPTLASVTLDANGHFTVSGTGRYKHGAFRQLVSPMQGRATGSAAFDAGGTKWTFTGASQVVMYPMLLNVGKRLLRVLALIKTSTTGTKSLRIKNIDSVGNSSVVETVSTTINLGGSWAFIEFNFADLTLSDQNSYWLEFLSGASSDELGGLVIEYDHP
ncbi:MAG TPA: hypothetical protein VFT58_01505 [Nitrososphaera sp.]|nr:hypothetical protein [Nitrososphaera sp.]